MWCVPKKQHDEKCENVKRQDPNNDSLYVQSHTQENNTDEIEVLIWNVHAAEVKTKHVQPKTRREEYESRVPQRRSKGDKFWKDENGRRLMVQTVVRAASPKNVQDRRQK